MLISRCTWFDVNDLHLAPGIFVEQRWHALLLISEKRREVTWESGARSANQLDLSWPQLLGVT